MPAPTTIVSAVLPLAGRAEGRGFARATDGSAAPRPITAAAPSARRRVIPLPCC